MFPPELVIVPTVGVTVMLMLRMRYQHRERMLSLQAQVAPDARMTRLESAVEAIAVEIERIGEGQRFVTKLLAERPPQLATAPERSARHSADSSRSPTPAE